MRGENFFYADSDGNIRYYNVYTRDHSLLANHKKMKKECQKRNLPGKTFHSACPVDLFIHGTTLYIQEEVTWRNSAKKEYVGHIILSLDLTADATAPSIENKLTDLILKDGRWETIDADGSGDDLYTANTSCIYCICEDTAIFGVTEKKGWKTSCHAYDFTTGKTKTVHKKDKEFMWISAMWTYNSDFADHYELFLDTYDWEVDC